MNNVMNGSRTFTFLFCSALFVGCITNRSRQFRPLTAAEKAALKPYVKQYSKQRDSQRVLLMTDFGNLVLRLYHETPLHSSNFLAKVGAGFYDSLLFHRVIKDFMVQGGDPTSRNAGGNTMLGAGSAPGNRIPAEFRTAEGIYHKKGAIAAARDANPEKASSNCQFYLVQGNVFRPSELDSAAANRGYQINEVQKRLYTTIGGAPHLDGGYTVFGEVEAGLGTIDSIAKQPTGAANRPKQPVYMRMFLLGKPKLSGTKR